MVSSSFTRVNKGQATSIDPGLYFSNHIRGKQHNLSNLVQSQISVNNPLGLQKVIQPVCNSLPQQTFLSIHPVLVNPNTGSLVPVTSENYFVPVSSYYFSSDRYNPYSNLWTPAVAAPLMSAQNTMFLRQLFFPQ